MHLHGETLERYIAADLPAGELATLDEHISNCIFCAAAFAHEGAAAEQWERRGLLGRLVRVEPEHAATTLAGDFEVRAA